PHPHYHHSPTRRSSDLGRAAWIEDVVHDPNFPRAKSAAKADAHGAFGFPIIGPGGFLGVMEFFSTETRQPDEAMLALFEGIGGQDRKSRRLNSSHEWIS